MHKYQFLKADIKPWLKYSFSKKYGIPTKYVDATLNTNTTNTLTTVSGKIKNFKLHANLEQATSILPDGSVVSVPNPDFPIDIHTITGNQEIKVTGKNLCNNVALSKSNNDIFFYFDKNISQTFTLSATINSATSSNSIYLILNGSSLGKVGEITGSANTKQSVTITFTNEIYEQIQNSTTRYLQLYKNNAGFTLPTDAQIEQGSTATTYEPYQSQSYEVNLGSMELCKIGDYQDYLYKENGIWYKYGAIGKVVLDGSENWATTSYSRFYCDSLIAGIKSENGLISNYFVRGNTETTNNVFGISPAGRIYIRNDEQTTLSNFKNWLSTHNTIVYYPLATPQYILLNDTLQSQLNAIENNMRSYKDKTNITVKTNINTTFDLSYKTIDS